MRSPLAMLLPLLLAVSASTVAAQTTVQSATPSRLSVSQGADGADLTITGTALQAITGARVLLNRRPVRTVAATVIQPRTAGRMVTRITVRVSAAATAASGEYQLELVAGRQVLPVQVSIVVGASGPPTPTRLPTPTRGTTSTTDTTPTRTPLPGRTPTSTVSLPSVSGATPANVQLQAGGTSQTVVISGSSLDEITGARVVQNGTAVQGVSIQVPSSRDPSRRNVMLAVPSGAEPPFGVQLGLVLEGSGGRSWDTPVRITVAAPPRADLSVQSMTLSDKQNMGLTDLTAGHTIRIDAEVRNGTGTAAADMAFTCRRLSGPGGSTQAQSTVRTGPVSAFGTRQLQLEIPAPGTGGSGYVSCAVDADGSVPESDESNNEMGAAFTAASPSSNDFRVEMRNFQPWTEGSQGHRSVRFEVANTSARGPVSPPPVGVTQRARWQANCTLPQLPWVRVREQGNMTKYPGGELPAAGARQSVSLWLFPVNGGDGPPVGAMPATLQMACTITTGAFLPNVPVVHNGSTTPQPDWGAPIEWWSQTVVMNIPNPEAGTYVPPQDIAITSLAGSGLATSNQPPRSDQSTYARFTVSLAQSVASLRVDCTASQSGQAPVTRTASLTNTGTSTSGTVDLGVLRDGNWTVRCEADPTDSIEDANRANNDRSASVVVFTPGPDLLVEEIAVRDPQNRGLTAPTEGNNIRVYAEVRNRSAESAPDMAFTCRRLTGPGGSTLAQATVRTGLVSANGSRRVQLDMAGSASAGPGYISCAVDGANQVNESDESNNVIEAAFTTDEDESTAFSVALAEFQPWTVGPNGHRSVRFEVTNISRRGAASPPPFGVNHRARWQAACTLPSMPWVNVRQEGNMTRYPGGEIPDAGSTQAASLWLFPVRFSNYPDVSSFPPTLLMSCNIVVGAFLPDVPVMHTGDSTLRPDWGAPEVWWSGTVMLTIPNPESGGR